MQIKRSVLPGHSILIPGRPVPATGVPIADTFLRKYNQLRYLPRIQYFGLLVSVSCLVYRNVNDAKCLLLVGLSVGCLTSQQQASVSQGRIGSDNCTCCHTETEVADPTFYLTQSQYTDTGPTSPSADPISPGAWQGSHWSASFEVTGMTRPRKKSRRKRDSNPGPSALEADALTTRPTRRSSSFGIGLKRIYSSSVSLE